MYTETDRVVREDTLEESAGEYQDHCKPFKDFKPSAKSRKMPLEGLESVSRGDQMCIFTFVAGFEPCRDKPDMGKPVGRLLKLRDVGGWHTLSLGLSSP